MSKFYDVVIIGGGPAGSSAATMLAKKGHSVLVLEKEKFPREHVGESLLPFCYQLFEEMGVLEEMKEKFSRKPGVTFSNIDGSSASHWCFRHVIKDDAALSFHVRRAYFDEVLLNNSRSNGAEVMEEVMVNSVDLSDPNQGIVKAQDVDGNKLEFKARIIIDASGQATLLAKQLNCKKPFTSLSPRVAFSTHWKNAKLTPELAAGNIKIVHLEGEKTGWFWMIPLKDDRLSIGVALDMAYTNKQRRNLSKDHEDWQTYLYEQELKSSAVAQEVIGTAERWGPVVANGDFSYYAEKKWDSNFAIIGDASGFLDPVFSSGIYLGMKGGMIVADGVSEMLKSANVNTITKAYEDINGAYKLVEELIKTFYDPGSIKWDKADEAFDSSYDKFETAYSILHLILAGDFFTNYEKYLKAIERLRNRNNIEKYKHLIGHAEASMEKEICLADA